MKKKLYIVTLEPIEKRYTKQWHSFFTKEFGKAFNVINIDGPILSDKIDKGRFLDINKTNIWKAKQTEHISKLFLQNKIKDSDSFLFTDGWHFGITATKYMAQLQNIKCKIFAYWHAGSWDKHDFLSQAQLNYWAKYNEFGWLLACDKHFVATNFHKNLISDYFQNTFIKNKIRVVGFPMDWIEEFKSRGINSPQKRKKDLIVFPHRLDKEKQPNKFDGVQKYFNKYPWKFIKTISVTKNKKDYYKLLSKAKVSFSASKQETFGIGTVEALMMEAIPLVPNRLAYKELYNPLFRYSNQSGAKQKLNFLMKNYDKVLPKVIENKEEIIKQSLDSIPKMIEIMKKVSK